MGKKIHNAKARQNNKIIVDNSELKNIQVNLDGVAEVGAGGYDEANALVLPSKKRDTKIKIEKRQTVKLLSKKQRKHLQTIVDKKKKKQNRAEVLEALAAVQIPETELKQYTSLSQVQTIGVKRLQTLDEALSKKQSKISQQQETATCSRKVSSIKGAAKRALLIEEEEEMEAKRRNPNFVGLDSEQGTSDEDSADEEAQGIDKSAEKSYNLATNTESPAEKAATSASEKEAKVSQTKKLPIANNAVQEKPSKLSKEVQPTRPTINIPVARDPEIQAARLRLPILAEEQQIMETINENSITIVAGETGSGKTTQIPQFLYEAGYAEDKKMIGITEPRRVAAIAMSKRVACEMNLSEREVSYLIRFEGNVTPDTRIKFMTDGVLLKEIESDFLLHNYSVIILDEAHERSAYTDILVGLLSRIVPLRAKRGNPLKLIIMSATLRVEDFTNNARLFRNPPPLIKVEARQYPVTIHFQKHTPANYVSEAFKKTVKIHAQLPEGGILVFLTGQQEVNSLVRKLRRTFPYTPKKEAEASKGKERTSKEAKIKESEEAGNEVTVANTDKVQSDSDDDFDIKRTIRNIKKSKKRFLAQMPLPKINLDDYRLPADDTEADMHENSTDAGENELENRIEDHAEGDEDVDDDDEDDEEGNPLDAAANLTAATSTKQPLWVLPLYSLLSTEKQNRIFKPVPEGCRLCVISTNVAETSLTIPNIKYVVDSGRQKTRIYDKITGVSAFVVTFTSKASAGQRAGRAGRVSAGHCYRLYSSAAFNNEFEDFSMPDIQKKPVDDLMLQMRCMGIDRVINFPFPSPPDAVQLEAAEKRLIVLGALASIEGGEKDAMGRLLPPAITELGRVISHFPVAPRFGKMLALSHQKYLLPYTVCLVAALSVQEVLMEVSYDRETDSKLNKWQKKRQTWAATGNFQLLGDPMVLLRAVGAAEFSVASDPQKVPQFCLENGLRHKAITEVRKLRVQLTNEINLNVSNVSLSVDPKMPPPTDAQARYLRQILLAGMGDRVARKVPLDDITDKDERRRLKYAYNCHEMEEPAFIHSSSVLKSKTPDWIVYQEIFEVRNGDSQKMYMRGLTAIEPEWLLLYVPLLCNVQSIREDPAPRYKEKDGRVYCYVDATFGKAGWELPLTEIEMPAGEKACCYFGMFLLEGVVCPKLAQFKASLKATPSSITKSWSNLNQSITQFKRSLLAEHIHSKQQLLDVWERKPNYLLEEYHNMLYNVNYSDLTSIWPPKTDD